MDGGVAAPEQQSSHENLIDHSWTEVRKIVRDTPYSETYRKTIQKVKLWEAEPKTTFPDWDEKIAEQVKKTKDLLTIKSSSARMVEGNGKIEANGNEAPPFGQEPATRLYIGIDPRGATDAFLVLLDQLVAKGVLKDIYAASYVGDWGVGDVTNNTFILYDPKSRPEVLDKILQAYKSAKQKRPDLFQLNNEQKARITRQNLQTFHAQIDENMSFVEASKRRGAESFDTNDTRLIREAFGLDSIVRPSDDQWLDRVVNSRKTVVYNEADREKAAKGLIKQGDTVHFERKLSAPALVQEGSFIFGATNPTAA